MQGLSFTKDPKILLRKLHITKSVVETRQLIPHIQFLESFIDTLYFLLLPDIFKGK